METTQMSVNWQMGKQNVVYIHTMKYYSALEKKEILIHAMIWINLENLLSERSQAQKATYFMISFIGNTRIGKSIETESRLVVS